MAKTEDTNNTESPKTAPSQSVEREPVSPSTGQRNRLLIVSVVAGFVVVALAAIVTFHHHAAARRDFAFGPQMANRFEGGHHMHGMMTRPSDNQSRLHGVVTKVEGDTITVAGGGKTNTVKTASSTKYSGGNSVVVNDTVIVSGTVNNGAFTATNIVVNP